MFSYAYRHINPREEIKALVFATLLLGGVLGFLAFSLLRSGPHILGTEMNANGMVEYLCLGNGCENFTRMDW